MYNLLRFLLFRRLTFKHGIIATLVALVAGAGIANSDMTVGELCGAVMPERLTTTLHSGWNKITSFFPSFGSHTSEESEGGYEIPIDRKAASQMIVAHTGYTLSYDKATNCPRWVAWELTADEVRGDVPRSNKFLPDPLLPLSCRVTSSDYRSSGYDRGHLCPAADMKWSEKAMRDCFYMSNMCPQEHELNAESWERLEERCREWASRYGRVYICAGPVFTATRPRRIGWEHAVAVTDAFFKAVLCLTPGEEKAIGFLYRNTAERQSLSRAAMTVRELERVTALDFFPDLDDDTEEAVETRGDVGEWE